MDKKSRIFFLVFFLLILSSVVVTYCKIVILRDYMIVADATCDPYTERCFVAECDSTTTTCTGDPAQDTSYFKRISRNAQNIPLCDPAAEGCDALVCPSYETDCSYTLCDPTTAKDGEICNDPSAYTLEKPIVTEEGNSTDEEGVVTGDEAEAGTEDVPVSEGAGTETNTDITPTTTPDTTTTKIPPDGVLPL
ncbi:MAG: hypothetical protein WCG73_00605 [Candidatus Moraniibacteriota bacterium]